MFQTEIGWGVNFVPISNSKNVATQFYTAVQILGILRNEQENKT